MRFPRQIVTLGLALALFSPALWADTATKDDVPEKIAALPWDAEVNVRSTAANAQILVIAHYVKEGAFDDTDTSYISVHRTPVTFDKDGRMVMHSEARWAGSKIRDYTDGWCSGGGTITKADKNGFDYQLALSWKIGKGNETKLNETFRGQWVKEQTFKKDGLTITVTVQLK